LQQSKYRYLTLCTSISVVAMISSTHAFRSVCHTCTNV